MDVLNPRNMEPPEDWLRMEPFSFIHTIDIHVHMPNGDATMLTFKNSFISLRMRGGMDNPSADDKSVEIPYLKNIKFFWNGLPCIDFSEKVIFPLENGLATMTVKSYSLLDAVKQIDAGGVLGNPPRAAALPDVIAESDSRIHKAHACIMNYIARSSYFYKFAIREMRENGIATMRAIRRFGFVAIPKQITDARDDVWKRMSFNSLDIPMDQQGWFRWADIIYEAGRKMNIDGNGQLDKYLKGFPSWFDSEVSTMRADTDVTLRHPALWGGLYPGCPNAANPHPLAGQPYVYAYSRKYFSVWCIKSNAAGKDKSTKFLLNSIDVCYSIDDMAALIQWNEITKETDCFYCNGKGHTAKQLLPDGSTLKCPTKVLDELRQESTGDSKPKFDKYKQRSRDQAKQITEMEEQIAQLSFEAANRLSDTNTRQNRRRFGKHSPAGPSSAHSADDDTTHDDDSEQPDQTVDDSSQSESSTIGDFADAMYKGKRPFNKRK